MLPTDSPRIDILCASVDEPFKDKVTILDTNISVGARCWARVDGLINTKQKYSIERKKRRH